MANNSNLISTVTSIIKSGKIPKIKGSEHQSVLLSVINSFGEHSLFAGVATPTTNPNNPDQNVFYIAEKKGIYTHFNNYALESGIIVLTNRTGSWVATPIDIASGTELDDINVRLEAIEDKILGEQPVEIIPHRAWSSTFSISLGNMYIGFYQNQSMLVGKYITMLRINVQTNGTIPLVVARGVNDGNTYVETHRRDVVLTEAGGTQDVVIDPPIRLEEGESFGFHFTTGSGNIRIYSRTNYEPAKNPVAGGMYTRATWTGNWSTNNYDDFSIGVFVTNNPPGEGGGTWVEPPHSWEGKKISFLGDSITTFNGWNPTGNATWYPTLQVTSVEQTWWKRLLNATGAVLEVNESWSATSISGSSNEAFTADGRVSNLGNPDIIIVFGGTNDFRGVGGGVLGDFDFSNPPNKANFKGALVYLYDKLSQLYPRAKIYVMTPIIRTDGGTPSTFGGRYLYQYQQAIKDAALVFGMRVISMDDCGIRYHNQSIYLPDGIHPNNDGMRIMFEHVMKQI